MQLSAANAALEARRGELETMLETIPNGVATLDADRRIVLANRALERDDGSRRAAAVSWARRWRRYFRAEVARCSTG